MILAMITRTCFNSKNELFDICQDVSYLFTWVTVHTQYKTALKKTKYIISSYKAVSSYINTLLQSLLLSTFSLYDINLKISSWLLFYKHTWSNISSYLKKTNVSNLYVFIKHQAIQRYLKAFFHRFEFNNGHASLPFQFTELYAFISDTRVQTVTL